MKAGIYKRRDNGKHVYVSGAGFVRAIEMNDVHLCVPCKVKTRNQEQVIEFDHETDTVVTADRVADAAHPYVNDVALRHYLDLQKATVELVGAVEQRFVGKHPALGISYGKTQTGRFEAAAVLTPKGRIVHTGLKPYQMATVDLLRHSGGRVDLTAPGLANTEDNARQVARACGYRFCHAQSAAKHRKRGHTVVRLGDGRYAWRSA